ncbi:MAG: hypothetical protein VXZ15_02910 [Planctomycetota bacterium]|nr:hypothetical protein [Planctomycetota bacterium]
MMAKRLVAESMVNPYQSPSSGSLHERSLGPHARVIQAAFLFRVIEFDLPFPARLRYSCWWWRQRIDINDQNLWFRVSWLRIHRKISFELPESVDPQRRPCRIDIGFSRGMAIRRFQVWIGDELAYDEQN